MSTIRIQTPQNVTVEYELASVGDRIIATILDYLVLFVWAVVWVGLFSALKLHKDTFAFAISFIVGVPWIFYHLLSEVFFSGQSIGKRARDLKVIRLDGTPPRLGDYLLRWLLRIIDVGIFSGAVAIITMLINGRGQRLGDLADRRRFGPRQGHQQGELPVVDPQRSKGLVEPSPDGASRALDRHADAGVTDTSGVFLVHRRSLFDAHIG